MRWKAVTEKDWHSHFALWPVKVDGEWVWLERVLRKGYKRSGSKIPSPKKGWSWDYVNSEFDLIKRAEAERAMQEMGSNVGQMAMQAKSAAYKQSGLTVTGSMGLKMPNMSGTAQNIINEIRSKQP